MSVFVMPGATALTRDAAGANSRARLGETVHGELKRWVADAGRLLHRCLPLKRY